MMKGLQAVAHYRISALSNLSRMETNSSGLARKGECPLSNSVIRVPGWTAANRLCFGAHHPVMRAMHISPRDAEQTLQWKIDRFAERLDRLRAQSMDSLPCRHLVAIVVEHFPCGLTIDDVADVRFMWPQALLEWTLRIAFDNHPERLPRGGRRR